MLNHSIIPVKMQLPLVSSFESYRTYVNSIPNLSEEEELSLLKKLKLENCVYSAQKLILSQLKTVLYITNQYKGYGLPQEDLVQEGNIGLMKAVKNFSLEHKVRLYTYALIWIKSEIQSYIIKNWKIVKIATTKNFKKLFFKLRSSQKELDSFGENNKIVSLIADKLGVSESEVIDMQNYLYGDDVSFSSEDNSFDFIDEFSNPEDIFESKHDSFYLENKLSSSIDKLNKNQKDVLFFRFYSEEKKTHKEISEILNVSSERVRQIEKEALSKLKKLLAN